MNEKYSSFYPFNKRAATDTSELVAEADGLCVLRVGYGQGSTHQHLCGYCVLHNRQVPKAWRGNYDADGLQYLNIHGGLTYCSVEGNYTVFGFDCAHSGDDENPKLSDPKYVLALAMQMRHQLQEYARVLSKWRGYGRKRRAALLQRIRDKGAEKSELGFGAMIDMLAGAEAFNK